LLYYSQTSAFAWDEGFHMLTAQLIYRGKQPYLDFFFPQAPLNAYWNAFWFGLFADTWHTAHAVAALCTSAFLLILGDYVYRRFPLPRWRFAGALAVMLMAGLNAMIVEFGTVGQAYGLCLVSLIAAFRVTVVAAGSGSILLSFAAGFFAGIASGSTLLVVLAGPLMALWVACSATPIPGWTPRAWKSRFLRGPLKNRTGNAAHPNPAAPADIVACLTALSHAPLGSSGLFLSSSAKTGRRFLW
jgi:hypothetical protein